MSKIKHAIALTLIMAAAVLLLILPSFALAAPTGGQDILLANGEAITVADPSTGVGNDPTDPNVDTSRPMWRHSKTLQAIVNPGGGRDALVYWKEGEVSGQPIYAYVYMTGQGAIVGGGVHIPPVTPTPLTANTSITQTGGRLSAIAGGGLNSDVIGNVSINITGGQCDMVVGGGAAITDAGVAQSATVTGNITIDASGGTIGWLFGGGAAITNAAAAADAQSRVEGNINVTLRGGVKLTSGAALGGVSQSSGNNLADSLVRLSGAASMVIDLPKGAPRQYALNGNPAEPIIVIGGALAYNAQNNGNAASDISSASIQLKSGTIYGLLSGGGAALRDGTGSASAVTGTASVAQTGGFLLPANGQGGTASAGGITILPASGDRTGLNENVQNASVHASGGMAQSVISNGVVLRKTATGYATTDYIQVYNSTGETVITGGSVKGAAGGYTAGVVGLYQITDPSLTLNPPTLPGGGAPVYRTKMLLHNVCGSSLAACTPHKNQPVSVLRGSAASYGMNDVYTDNSSAANEAGGVYVWLPRGSKTFEASSGGAGYTYAADHLGKDAHYGDTTAGDGLTWMVLRGVFSPAPHTGDNSRLLIWLSLCLICGAGAVLTLRRKRRGA